MVVLNHGEIAMEGAPAEIFTHGDELRRMGLDTPVMTDVADRLRALGVNIQGSVYTVEQMVSALMELEGGGRRA